MVASWYWFSNAKGSISLFTWQPKASFKYKQFECHRSILTFLAAYSLFLVSGSKLSIMLKPTEEENCLK